MLLSSILHNCGCVSKAVLIVITAYIPCVCARYFAKHLRVIISSNPHLMKQVLIVPHFYKRIPPRHRGAKEYVLSHNASEKHSQKIHMSSLTPPPISLLHFAVLPPWSGSLPVLRHLTQKDAERRKGGFSELSVTNQQGGVQKEQSHCQANSTHSANSKLALYFFQ